MAGRSSGNHAERIEKKIMVKRKFSSGGEVYEQARRRRLGAGKRWERSVLGKKAVPIAKR